MSIIWVMRSMPSVVMFSTWVSPRLNNAEPWARFSTPTSADSGRMSLGPRPSRRTPSAITRARMTFFCSCFHAGPNSLPRVSKSAKLAAMCSLASALSVSSLASRSALSVTIDSSSRDFANEDSASYRSSPKRGRGVHSFGVTPAASMNSCWNSSTSAIARLAASRPSATVSSVGRLGPGGQQLPGLVGRLALDHQDVDLTGIAPAAGDDHVERGLLGLGERRVDGPLSVDQRRPVPRPPGRRTAGPPGRWRPTRRSSPGCRRGSPRPSPGP